MTENKITIQDALSELNLINQKIDRNNNKISKFSSKLAAYPDEIDNQAKEMKTYTQSNIDLLTRWLHVKTAINKSNLVTSFEFEGRVYTISDALLYKQGYLDMLERFYGSFTDRNAREQLRAMKSMMGRTEIPKAQTEAMNLVPKLFYNAKKMQDELDHLLELRSHLDRLIDKSNHSTFVDI